jgi:hypothetical protein
MTVIAEGYNCFETTKSPGGIVKFLPHPPAVLALIKSGKLKEHIILVQGGTTTFLAPALTMGAIGIITMSGAPESHLGILSREFQIPCVMTVHLVGSASRYATGSENAAHFAELSKALDGRRVKLVCDGAEIGRVLAA